MIKKIPAQLWVFAGSFIFFLLTLSENFSGAHDSINYLNGIVDGYPLVNQHHLLYHYAAYVWLHLWQPIFSSVKNYYIIEAFSALWGSCSMAVVYSFFRNRFGFSIGQTIACMLVVLFSYGFWLYSTVIEVYAPPLFFILLALYYLTQRSLSMSDWWKVIFLHILAILFHQINILFAPVILFKMWQLRKQSSFFRLLASYAVSGALFVGTAYFIVGWIVEKQNTVAKWIAWMKGYAGGDSYWQPLTAKTPVNVTYGFAHAFLGGHYVFQLPPVQKVVNSSLSSHSLGDELYIARNVSSGMAMALAALTGILLLIMLWLLIRFIRNFKKINATYPAILVPLLATFFVYSLFFTFWMPEILEFWILQTVIVWWLLLGTLPVAAIPFKMKVTHVALVLAPLLFAINYFGSVKWMQDKRNDFYFVKTERVEQAVGANDVVVVQSAWIVKDFLHYFTRVNVQAVPEKDSSQVRIDSAINNTLDRKGRVFILPENSNKMDGPDTHYLDSVRSHFSGRLRKVREHEPEMWVIE